MATMRGERFHIDLDDQDLSKQQQTQHTQQTQQTQSTQSTTVNAGNMLGDIVERTPSAPKPPSAPVPSTGSTMSGWPALKKRYQKSNMAEGEDIPSMLGRTKSFSIEDTPFDSLQRQEIDAENRRRISEMSLDDIERERKELFENLNPGLIAKLLARSSIDDQEPDGSSNLNEETNGDRRRPSASGRRVSFAVPDDDAKSEKSSAESHSIPLSRPMSYDTDDLTSQTSDSRRPSSSGRKVSFATPENDAEDNQKGSATSHSLPMTLPATESNTSSQSSPRKLSSSDRKVSFADPEDNNEEDRNTAERHSLPSTPSMVPLPDTDLAQPENVHFPKPPVGPDLDPSSVTFLDDLHEKYFPNLAHDPSKLNWMKPSTKAENASYNPSEPVLPSDLRFSFKGEIIPPDVAMTLPTNLGLHHHGDTPDAAGYTISELGTLARSAFPAQRCITFQTLGRVLYRLGKGEYGDESNIGHEGPSGNDALVAKDLWDEVEKARITDTLTEWANKDSGHRTSIALAQEAVWNWQQGGGRKTMSS
jgi:RNA polymerase II-associated protein 1